MELESGRMNDRPRLVAALDLCRRRRAVLVIAKLDRLARSNALISGLVESGVEFVAADVPEANRFMLHIMAAVAEHEREMISQRNRAALAAAKARGPRLSSPRSDTAKARAVASGNAAEFRATVLPQIQALHAEGRSLLGIAAELNAKGVNGRRGGSWHAASIQNVVCFTNQL